MASTNTTNTTFTELPEAYYTILTILGSLGFLFNGVLLFVFWRNKTPEFRLGTSYVIGSLALADCLTGVAVLLYVTRYRPIELVQLPMVWTTIQASLLSLMFLSVERTLAFRYPFASKSILTVKRTIAVIALIWMLATTCGIFVHFYQRITQLAMTIIFEVCVMVFLVSQGYIISKMQQRKRNDPFCDHDVSMVTRKHIQRQQKNNNVTKVVLILIVVVVVTLLPYMVALQILFLSELNLRPLNPETAKNIGIFLDFFYPVELLNFIVNPIIYAYRLKRYRNAFFEAFSFLQCGPFVKKRARTFSSLNSDDYRRRSQMSQKMLTRNKSQIKNDGNLNSIEPTHC